MNSQLQQQPTYIRFVPVSASPVGGAKAGSSNGYTNSSGGMVGSSGSTSGGAQHQQQQVMIKRSAPFNTSSVSIQSACSQNASGVGGVGGGVLASISTTPPNNNTNR